MRSRSFSRCKRAISAAWSADGSVACVVGRRAAAVGSVVVDGRLRAIVSIGDIVKHRIDELQAERDQLVGYIQQ